MIKVKIAEKTKESGKKPTVKRRVSKLVLPLHSQKGETLKRILLPENVFGQKSNSALVSQTIRVYLSTQKQRTSSTKTRGEIAGGGRKPHRQKGTGRARAGSIRAPGRRGGGTVFGPHPGVRILKLTKKMRKKALTIVLSDKLSEGSITLVDKLTFKEPKTKKALEFLDKINLASKRRLLLVLEEKAPAIVRSFRNLPEVVITRSLDLNALDVLKSSGLILTLAALEQLKQRYENKSD